MACSVCFFQFSRKKIRSNEQKWTCSLLWKKILKPSNCFFTWFCYLASVFCFKPRHFVFFATIRVNLLKKVFDQELKENRKDYVHIQILPIELKFTPHVISSDPGRIVIHWAHFFSFSSFNWNSFFFFQTICVLKSHWPL